MRHFWRVIVLASILTTGSIRADDIQLVNHDELVQPTSAEEIQYVSASNETMQADGGCGNGCGCCNGCGCGCCNGCGCGCCNGCGCCQQYCYDWSGFYIGAQLGEGWLSPFSPANQIQPNSKGIVGGGFVGRNWQCNRLVFGAEGDFNGSNLSATAPANNPAFNANFASSWNASVRGRLGLAFDRLLVFGTAGYAVGNFDGFTQRVAGGQLFPDSRTISGFAVGGGIEYALTCNILVRAEYRFERFGQTTFNYDVPYTVQPNLHMMLFGASYKF